ncbi:MAG: hypothetical protein U9R75_10250, partial [Candidatus Thermoplasmatota archaeon]|nr:hypothetical protein [Candidatus Thermoplasmatota archaeon]
KVRQSVAREAVSNKFYKRRFAKKIQKLKEEIRRTTKESDKLSARRSGLYKELYAIEDQWRVKWNESDDLKKFGPGGEMELKHFIKLERKGLSESLKGQTEVKILYLFNAFEEELALANTKTEARTLYDKFKKDLDKVLNAYQKKKKK